MKTKIATSITICSILLLIIPISLTAQKVHTSIDKEFEWIDKSKNETLFIDVKKKSSNLLISMAGAIEKGILEVNVFNPDGDKIPGFSLVSDGSEAAEVSVGYSTGDNPGTQITTTTSSSGSTTSITTTPAPSAGSSSNVAIGSDTKGNSYAVSTSTRDSKGAKGVMNKILPNPKPGKWKVIIVAKHVTGKLNIAFDQE